MTTGQSLIFLCILKVLAFVQAVKFPNDIAGQPDIECNDGTVRITVNTTTGVASRIFAKGHYSTVGCSFERTNSAVFNIGACGMNRQRQLEPRGISYGLVVVIQLHPLFVTKVDRAYNLKCFYMETDKSVTSLLDVSMLSTETITFGTPMPVCTYALHADNPNGPIARYARVGDKVWHTWTCPSDNFGMLVHSCFVTDGEGSEFKIIDEHGCGVDQYVIRTPIYSNDLNTVQQETHVFKFADKTALVFNCQIKLCMKVANGCAGITPPNCNGSLLGNETLANYTEANFPLNFTGTPLSNETLVNASISAVNISSNISEFGNATLANQTAIGNETRSNITFNETLATIGPGFEIRFNYTTVEVRFHQNETAPNLAQFNNRTSELANTTLSVHVGSPSASPPAGFNETGNVTLTPVQIGNQSQVNISGAIEEAASPRLLLLDGRGRRNAFGRVGGEPIPDEPTAEELASIPIKHERHIIARLLDDTINIGDIETDVSQSMWVLEPEEAFADDHQKHNHHHQNQLDQLPASVDAETSDHKNQSQPNSVCISPKVLWAMVVPMALLMIITMASVILCVYRLRRESSDMTIKHLFPFTYMYKNH